MTSGSTDRSRCTSYAVAEEWQQLPVPPDQHQQDNIVFYSVYSPSGICTKSNPQGPITLNADNKPALPNSQKVEWQICTCCHGYQCFFRSSSFEANDLCLCSSSTGSWRADGSKTAQGTLSLHTLSNPRLRFTTAMLLPLLNGCDRELVCVAK